MIPLIRSCSLKPPPGTQLAQGGLLAGLWNMNEGGGNRFADAVRGTVPSLNTGGPTWSMGDRGPCASFDGTQWLDAGDWDWFTPTATGITVIVRFNARSLPTTVGANHRAFLISKGINGQYEWYANINPVAGGSHAMEIFKTNLIASQAASRVSTTSINTGQWYEVAFAFNNDMTVAPRLYINGLLDEATSTTGTGTSANGTATMQIGRRADNAENKLDGLIDYVHFFNRQLIPSEVMTHFIDSQGLFQQTDPAARWLGIQAQTGGLVTFIMNAGLQRRPYQLSSALGGDSIQRGQS